ncbi:MAG: hypothetical protein U0800_27085 [Isosphaeraceae bacterium]
MSNEFRLLEATSAFNLLDEFGRFLDYWFGQRRPEYGEPPESLDRLRLPRSLRHFYEIAGRWPSAEPDSKPLFYEGGGGHHLREPAEIEATEDGKLDFFMEYQGDWSGLTLPDEDDPPVWLRGCFEGIEEVGATISVGASLSRFLVTHGFMTILYEYENAPCALSARQGPLVDRFHDKFGPAVKIWDASGLEWPTSCLDYRGEFFLIPFSGGILVHRDGDDFHFGALRPGGIQVMLGEIGRGAHE